LDPLFGTDGIVTTSSGYGGEIINGLAIDAAGRIVAGGAGADPGINNGRGNFDLARYLTDGSLDPSFGAAGKVAGPAGVGYGLAIDGAGRIVAGGEDAGNYALARYLPSGELDPTFGTGGKVSTPVGAGGNIYGLAIDGAGRIVVGGKDGGNFALARFLPGGALDPAFGTGGIVRADIGPASDQITPWRSTGPAGSSPPGSASMTPRPGPSRTSWWCGTCRTGPWTRRSARTGRPSRRSGANRPPLL
jgi:uncharacterized delta-60 repeat protein